MKAHRARLVMIVLALAAVLAAAGDGAAQRRPRRRPPRWFPPPRPMAPWQRPRAAPEFGIRGGYDFDTRSGSIGSDLRLPVPGGRGRLALVPSGDLFFSSPRRDWQLNIDGELRAPRTGLYGGGGAAFIHHEFTAGAGQETKPGWNLFAGLEPSSLPIRPYVETRWTLRGEHYSAFRLVGGLHIALGGHRRWR